MPNYILDTGEKDLATWDVERGALDLDPNEIGGGQEMRLLVWARSRETWPRLGTTHRSRSFQSSSGC